MTTAQLLNESQSNENLPVDNPDAKDELCCDTQKDRLDVDYPESRETLTEFEKAPLVEPNIDSQMERVTVANTDTQNCVLGDHLLNARSHLKGKSSTREFHSSCECDDETSGHNGVSTTKTSNKENSHKITSDIKTLQMKNKDNIEQVDSRNGDDNHDRNERKES